MNALAGAAFLEQVSDGVLFGNEKKVRESIGQDAVDLFRHAAVKAAQAGLDVGDVHAELHRGKGNGDGGIDVADDENQVRAMVQQDGLNALQDFGGLGRVGAGADLEVDVRGGNPHLAKENIGKLFVVVLAGVNENGLDFRVLLHYAHERRNFGEIGAGSDDVDDLQSLAHEMGGLNRTALKYSIASEGFPGRGKRRTPKKYVRRGAPESRVRFREADRVQ